MAQRTGFGAAGVEGVTGVYSANPNGSGATTGVGVGFWVDTDGADDATGVDDFGPLVMGFDYSFDLTQTNPLPGKGFVQVVVPFPADNAATTPAALPGYYPGVYTNNAAVEVTITTDPNYVPKIAVSGDFDSDFDSDATDLAAAAAGFGGAGVGTKWYANGNVDADGDTDNKDLGYVIGAFTPSSSSGSATLTYDPATGNVKLDTTTAAGAKITSFQLANASSTFVPGSYAGPAFGGTYQDTTTDVIGNTDTTLAGATGEIDLGNVLPTGMDLAGLGAYLTTAVYTGEAGSGQQPLTLAVAGGGNNFVDWIDDYPGVGLLTGVEDDADGDGIDNGIENYFGTDPSVFSAGLASAGVSGSVFTFTHPLNDTPADDLTSVYVWSKDLGTWHADGGADGGGTTVTFAQGTPSGGMVTVTATVTGTATDKLFVRVSTTQD